MTRHPASVQQQQQQPPPPLSPFFHQNSSSRSQHCAQTPSATSTAAAATTLSAAATSAALLAQPSVASHAGVRNVPISVEDRLVTKRMSAYGCGTHVSVVYRRGGVGHWLGNSGLGVCWPSSAMDCCVALGLSPDRVTTRMAPIDQQGVTTSSVSSPNSAGPG